MAESNPLFEIQQRFKSKKDERNDFGGFNYRNAETMLNSLKPLLKEYNCTLIFEDEAVTVDGWHYIKSKAVLQDDSRTWSAQGWAREPEHKTKSDDAQVTGMAMSYARKYALGALFAVDDGNDPDSHDNTGNGQTDVRSAKVSQKPPQNPTEAKSEHSKAKDALWKTIQSRADNDGTTPNEVTKTVDSHAREKFGHPLSECGDTEMLLLDAWLRGEVSDVSTD